MEQLTEVKRILYTYIKPTAAMKDIGRKPGFAVPIVCIVVFPLLSVILNISYYQNQFYMLMQQQMMALDLTMDLTSVVQIQLYSTMGMAPVMALLSWLAFSVLVYLLSLMFEGEGEIGMKTVLSITGYAFLIKAVYYVFTTVNMMVMPDRLLTFSLFDIVGGSVGNIYVMTLLQLLSVFRLWEYAVVALGLSAVKEISKGKAFTVMGLILVLNFAVTAVQLVMANNLLGAVA